MYCDDVFTLRREIYEPKDCVAIVVCGKPTQVHPDGIQIMGAKLLWHLLLHTNKQRDIMICAAISKVL